MSESVHSVGLIVLSKKQRRASLPALVTGKLWNTFEREEQTKVKKRHIHVEQKMTSLR